MGLTPSSECLAAVARAERLYAVQPHLLGAIAHVESGRSDASGHVLPWPWTVNAEGVGSFYESKSAAIAAVRGMQARGMRSIDVGCMQINLQFHPDAFNSLEQAFDPTSNADYAARFLLDLKAQSGNWMTAAGNYHSATPELRAPYQAQVAAVLAHGGNEMEMASAGAAAGGATSFPGRFVAGQDGAAPLGAFMMSNGANRAHILPAADSAAPGRGLDAYRRMPTQLAFQRIIPAS